MNDNNENSMMVTWSHLPPELNAFSWRGKCRGTVIKWSSLYPRERGANRKSAGSRWGSETCVFSAGLNEAGLVRTFGSQQWGRLMLQTVCRSIAAPGFHQILTEDYLRHIFRHMSSLSCKQENFILFCNIISTENASGGENMVLHNITGFITFYGLCFWLFTTFNRRNKHRLPAQHR